MTTISQRIVTKFLKAGVDLPMPMSWHVTRTRAGSEQRAEGAFSWFLHSDQANLPYDLGSYWSASLCARPGGTVTRSATGNLILTPSADIIQGYSPASWRRQERLKKKARQLERQPEASVKLSNEARAAFQRRFGGLP